MTKRRVVWCVCNKKKVWCGVCVRQRVWCGVVGVCNEKCVVFVCNKKGGCATKKRRSGVCV